MCGIALIVDDQNNLEIKTQNIISEIKHRGPDDEGFYFEKNLALGSNRLSILDLSSNSAIYSNDESAPNFVFKKHKWFSCTFIWLFDNGKSK